MPPANNSAASGNGPGPKPHDMESAVMEFVARTLRVRRDRLTLDTTLLGDLGVDGDDADEFLAAFAAEFHADLSALNLAKRFGGEGYRLWQIPLLPFHALVQSIRPWLSGKTPEDCAGLVPTTIGDLVAAAKTGRDACPPSVRGNGFP